MDDDHLGLQRSRHGLSECVCPLQPFGKQSRRASWLSTRNVRLLQSLPCFCSASASSACKAVRAPWHMSCHLHARVQCMPGALSC